MVVADGAQESELFLAAAFEGGFRRVERDHRDGVGDEGFAGEKAEPDIELGIRSVAGEEPVVPGGAELLREEGGKIVRGAPLDVGPPGRGEGEEPVGGILAAAQAGFPVERAGPVALAAQRENLEPRVPERGERKILGGGGGKGVGPGGARGGVVHEIDGLGGYGGVPESLHRLGPDPDALARAAADEEVAEIGASGRGRGGGPRKADHVEAGERKPARETVARGGGILSLLGGGQGNLRRAGERNGLAADAQRGVADGDEGLLRGRRREGEGRREGGRKKKGETLRHGADSTAAGTAGKQKKWWQGRESDPRHRDFQSPALPLSYLATAGRRRRKRPFGARDGGGG